MSSLELFAPVVAILGLAYSLVFWNHVQRADSGTPAMQKVAAAILQGANAFVKRQYRTIAILTIVTAVGMTVVYGLTGGEEGWVKGFEVGGS
ncbi:MAG TPA: sodium/proton-translocating pyrophosphatase, partial [Candidatus Peribacteraceae bacterium]|nr:sodium/proton-translocating pyrophosphatase [Candidatus Peribacteraceae bacterium]